MPGIKQDSDFHHIVLEEEIGGRELTGPAHMLMLALPLCWSLFQLWIVSPFPYDLGIGVFNETATRSIHLGFGVMLAYIGFPMLKKSPRNRVPFYDWILALAATFCVLYIYVFQSQLILRIGAPTNLDIAVSFAGVLLLLEATRRIMGLPMTIVACLFLIFAFAGPYMPGVISHQGASLSRAASHFWLTTDGVFGVPLGVSTSVVFLYVLFGAMLERAGAGNYLTTLSFALLGHLRGGPAKAAVVASGLHGLISGSSIANVLTCGPVTIMLMKKVGFSSEKAGAIEVAAGSNGQIMPPVMGAAAFLMVEYIDMSYAQLIKHAFIPAILAYASLLYIVHLEACKLNMSGLPRRTPRRFMFLGWGITIASLIILLGIAHYLIGFLVAIFGDQAWLALSGLLLGLYIALIYISSKYPPLPEEPDQDELPPILATLFSGLHFFIPIAILVWCLIILNLSPELAAFYACVCLGFIIISKEPLQAFMRKHDFKLDVKRELLHSLTTLADAMISGARNMVGIALATAAAGIIVGVVSLTGVGQVLAAVVEQISMGYFPIVLIMTAILSLILGMGLPTTANYIIVSTLLAPVIYDLGAANGMVLPLVAVHLFCLYFGVMADATPPVALAAFAASGISGGDPLKTGAQAFLYEMRTAILPIVFIYNPEILLINVHSGLQLVWVLLTAFMACMAFASITQNFWLVKNRWWEIIMLILAMILLFRPGIMLNEIYPPFVDQPAAHMLEYVENLEPDDNLKFVLQTNKDGQSKIREMAFPVPEGPDKLEQLGFYVQPVDSYLEVVRVEFGTRADKLLGDDVFEDNRILSLQVPADQPSKYWFNLPGIALFALVFILQRRRQKAL